MKKFEVGKIYKDSKGKEYQIIGRSDKTVVIEDTNKPGNSLYQTRKTIQTYESGNEYITLEKGTEPSYRNHKKSVGRYLVSSGKAKNIITA